MSVSRSRKSETLLFCIIICVGFVITFVVLCHLRLWTVEYKEEPFVFRSLVDAPVIKILPSTPSSEIRNSHCSYFNCFNVYKCAYSQRKLKIYIYPIYKYGDLNGVPIPVSMSRQFKEILQSIYQSKYYVSDPREACIFVPSIDLLSQNNLRLKETSQVLASLPYWHDGSNHLLFNMLPGSAPEYNPVLEVDSHNAMIAGGGFSTWTYRKTHDVSLPVYSLIEKTFDLYVCKRGSRPHFLASSQINIHAEY
ncbi:hypothetical protein JTE90_015655 [Oedothorax gibbosus]|uniref:Exostosin GT47 domain-containing protein n=1 Tax=Oedothorax gibbosus TaxID=931172 RepID=A0AAV6USK1_9ARAC|nr:hypothetical protein JTE90_015655 [Oedothorax gibbosus]